MTEISFARSFLSALDMRPVKLSSDHIADPKQYPPQPAPVLPRHPNQPQKRKRDAIDSSSSAAVSDPTLTVILKSVKGTETTVTLQRQPLSTGAYDLKAAYAKQAGVPVDKIRLLYSKKPVADSKALKDLLGSAAEKPPKEMAFSVMVIGGGGPAAAEPERATSPPAQAPAPDVVAQQVGPSGSGVLQTDEFWADLEGFLRQRIKDDREGGRLAGIFREAWQKDA